MHIVIFHKVGAGQLRGEYDWQAVGPFETTEAAQAYAIENPLGGGKDAVSPVVLPLISRAEAGEKRALAELGAPDSTPVL